MFTHRPRAGVRLDDDSVTFVEPPVTGIDGGANVVQVEVDLRGRVNDWRGGGGGVGGVRGETGGGGIKAGRSGRLFGELEGDVVFGGGGEGIFKVVKCGGRRHGLG